MQRHPPTRLRLAGLALSSILLFSGCSDRAEGADATVYPPPADYSGVVDSILPMDEEIRRFRLTIGEAPNQLEGGTTSRDALVRGFVEALERQDTAALADMVLTRGEFIELYFPHTVYMTPPYEMKPSFIWFQMTNLSSRGITRAYQRFSGRDLNFLDYVCAPSPAVEGPNRIWDRCALRFAPDGEEVRLRLFGMILERDGRFKFITYGNDL